MNTKIAIIGLTAALACAGGAQAGTHAAGSAYAEPSQPVPYSALGSYMKASPSKRARTDWSMAAATPATGAAVNTSATLPNSPPDATAPAATAVNPPMNATPQTPPADTAPSTMAAPDTMTPNTTAPSTPTAPVNPQQ